MKDHEASPLAFEYPPPDSYFLKQRHLDTLDGNDADTVYKELSLLATFEVAVNEAGGPTTQSNLRTLSLSQPLSPSPFHLLRDGAGGRVSVLSAPSALEAGETDKSSIGTTGGSQGSVDLSATQCDNPTNSRCNSTTFSSRGKPFQATISTNTGGSSSPCNVETTDFIQQDALPQDNDVDVAADNDGDHIIDDDCPPSADGGPTALPASHREGVIGGLSTPLETCTSPLPGATTHFPSQHAQSPLRQQLQQQKMQQNQHLQTNTHPRDAEDNAMSMDIHHRVDNEIIQSRMDIEHRRQPYNSTQQQQHQHLHLPPFPPAVAKTVGSNSRMTMTTRRRVSNMPPFDRQHRFARRDYTSPTYLEDFVLTRRGSINDKNWTTSLTPRATVLPFKPAIDAKKQALQGLETSDAVSPPESSSSSSSSVWARWLPEPSSGHEIHPPTEPGPVYGVNRPKFTHQYVMYDVPFYGIENVEISSSRYQLLTQSDSTKELEETDERRSSSGADVGVGGSGGGREVEDGKDGIGLGPLSDHREHIWSVAHEHEYGPETGAGAVEENVMLRERLKRAQVILPIVRPVPAAVSSTSGSGLGSGSGEAQLRQGYRGGGTNDLRFDVEYGSQLEFSQMTVSSSASRSTNTTNSNIVQLIPMKRHGRGNCHGQVPRRPRRPRPVSEGVYGPDTFQESLENLKYVPERPRGWRAKMIAITRQHWKTLLCVGSMFLAAIVIPLVLVKKKGGGIKSNDMANVGQGGEDLGFEGGATIMTAMEPSGGGGGRTIVTKTVKLSSTRSVKVTPTSTTKSWVTPTSKATTAKRTTAIHVSSRRRPKISSRNVAPMLMPTRTPTPRASSP
ncbi:MAG: hypothetical protein JOS17DRAFT_785675 [Linnemannia elongata]|nr:MAG: hypothetical protein JOS17DRAFT_785675 [Linnemannia elongata]